MTPDSLLALLFDLREDITCRSRLAGIGFHSELCDCREQVRGVSGAATGMN